MTKFDMVRIALQSATKDTNNFLSLREGPRDARDPKGGYHTFNLVTCHTVSWFKTLDEVIEAYNLKRAEDGP